MPLGYFGSGAFLYSSLYQLLSRITEFTFPFDTAPLFDAESLVKKVPYTCLIAVHEGCCCDPVLRSDGCFWCNSFVPVALRLICVSQNVQQWRASGPIHTGRRTRCATRCKQMGTIDVNGGVHTARKQHQRKNIRIYARVASRILCGLGLVNFFEHQAVVL